MVAVIDYGMGNLASVAKAVAFLGGKACITSDPVKVRRADGVILPGVGAFGEAMRELTHRRLIDPIRQSIQDDKPFLGLCLGLQLLFSDSEESPGIKGLGILSGRVRRLSARGVLKVPHMGWNQIVKVAGKTSRDGRLLQGIPDGAFMYFVHSFVAQPSHEEVILAVTEYGREFPSVLYNGRNVWATQFHPEKSQRWGLRILRNFLNEVSLC